MSKTVYENLPIDYYYLNKTPVATEQRGFDRVVLHHPKLTEFRDEQNQALVRRLVAYVLTEEHQRVYASYPTTWWDAIKDHFFPKWLQEQADWLAPNYTTISIEPRVIYPFIKLQTPEFEHRVKIIVRREPS